MKKGLVFLSALLSTLVLTGCNLGSLSKDINDIKNNSTSLTDADIVDKAIHFAKFGTLFLDVEEQYDFSEFMSFESSSGWSLSDYEITSKDASVVSVTKTAESFEVKGLKDGFTYLQISGPGITGTHKQRIYVGSFDGEFKTSQFPIDISLNLADQGKTFQLSVGEGVYHGDDIAEDYCTGTFDRDLIAVLCLNFNGSKPKEVKPLESFATQFDIDLEGVETNAYGFLTYEERIGVQAKIVFHDEVVTLTNNKRVY